MSKGMMKRLLALAGLLLLAACATPVTQRAAIDSGAEAAEVARQQALAMASIKEQVQRAWRLSRPLLTANADLCEKAQMADPGFLPWFGAAFNPDPRFGIRPGTPEARGQVLAVAPGSPAERAGIKTGDELRAVDGVVLPPDLRAPLLWREALKSAAGKGRYAITLGRDGTELNVDLEVAKVCAYPVFVINGDEVNAFADGKAMYVTRGMMRFAQEDRELSLVLGHELAHNIMSHIDKKMTNAGLGLILDLLAAVGGVNTQGAFSNLGAGAYSQEFEAEADYVGIYLLARAGFDTSGTADFWRRMAAEHPGNIRSNHAASHPATSQRFIAIEQTIAEVDSKRKAGQPLMPNMASRRAGE